MGRPTCRSQLTPQQMKERRQKLNDAIFKLRSLPIHIRALKGDVEEINKSPWWKKKNMIEEARKKAQEIEEPLSVLGIKVKVLREEGEKVAVTDAALRLADFISEGKVEHPRGKGEIGFLEFINKRKEELTYFIGPGKPFELVNQLAKELRNKINEALSPIQEKLFG
ncbi:MAG: hypothetical protein QXG98_00915 [Candidatus Micrarchaeia archaeon]